MSPRTWATRRPGELFAAARRLNGGNPVRPPANAAALGQCCAWLRQGGALVAFPAGEVAHRNGDPPWNPAAVRIAQRTGADAIGLRER